MALALRQRWHRRALVGEASHFGPSTLLSIPCRGQLLLYFVSRVCDMLPHTVTATLLPLQLKSLDGYWGSSSTVNLDISTQAGIVVGCFTIAESLTAMLWIQAADNVGRKPILVMALLGNALSCLGVGFSRSWIEMAIWRMLGGCVSPNPVIV